MSIFYVLFYNFLIDRTPPHVVYYYHSEKEGLICPVCLGLVFEMNERAQS